MKIEGETQLARIEKERNKELEFDGNEYWRWAIESSIKEDKEDSLV